MQFDDIAHKYILYEANVSPPDFQAQIMLWHICNDGTGAVVGWFKDEVIARNVALALQFYKEKNKMIDGVVRNE